MALLQTDCPELELVARGKVRDIYDIDQHSLLFVATDRISAYDVIMKSGIPNKGKILTQLSCFWFDLLKNEIPNHLITANLDEMPPKVQKYASQLRGRSMLVKKLNILPVEAIVRGYITGSGMAEYKKNGTICEIELPKGLVESQKLPEPLFTPSTKAEIGQHDENIHPSKLTAIVGKEKSQEIAKYALSIYKIASDYAASRGIIIADTKFEFGWDDKLILADEVLTPDSSRFWPLEQYKSGQIQASFDKQYVRDYLTSINFDKKQGVELPPDVIKNTVEKYITAYKMLVGSEPILE